MPPLRDSCVVLRADPALSSRVFPCRRYEAAVVAVLRSISHVNAAHSLRWRDGRWRPSLHGTALKRPFLALVGRTTGHRYTFSATGFAG